MAEYHIPSDPSPMTQAIRDGKLRDSVESPRHYTQGWLETIYVIRQTLGPEGFKAFCLGNWIKYNERHAHKNGAEDLAKANQYLEWAQNGLPEPVNGMYPR